MAAKRPTLREVARLAGVSLATASRVLNEHPDVSPEAEAAVRRAMERLAYRPDPVLRALGRYRWPEGRRSTTPAIAYLVDRWTGSGPHKEAALRERAEGLGYRTETVHLTATTDLAALTEALIARGVGGLIIDLHGDAISLDLPWEHFAAVVVGEGLPHLAKPRISTDWLRVSADAITRLQRLGCARIGFIVRRYEGRGLRDELVGAAHAAMAIADGAGYSSAGVLVTSTDVLISDGAVADWYRSQSPDGVIGDSPRQFQQIRTAGARPSFRFLSVLNGGERFDRVSIAGYRQDLGQRIRRAVDLVHSQLLHGERG
jgi:DNA-binding LacI/PurR family transcriptional regulator